MFAVHDLSKSYVKTTSHKYVAKTESQQREELHTRALQSATTCSSSASVSLEQSMKHYSHFLKETDNKLSFTSDKIHILHYNCAKKFQKLIEKQDIRVHPKISSSQRENSFNDNFLQKKILSKFL